MGLDCVLFYVIQEGVYMCVRSISYTLEIECGRFTKPKTDNCERLCPVCNADKDEIHFLCKYKSYEAELSSMDNCSMEQKMYW